MAKKVLLFAVILLSVGQYGSTSGVPTPTESCFPEEDCDCSSCFYSNFVDDECQCECTPTGRTICTPPAETAQFL